MNRLQGIQQQCRLSSLHEQNTQLFKLIVVPDLHATAHAPPGLFSWVEAMASQMEANPESAEEFVYYSQVVVTDLIGAAAHEPGVYSATTRSVIRTVTTKQICAAASVEEDLNKCRNSERTKK